jgi:membrane protein YqaA with SNARE-associated domain
MHLWLLTIAALIVQEFATSALVLVAALQNNHSLWIINVIWLGTTTLDIYIGYRLGKFLHTHYQGSWLVKKTERWVQVLRHKLGKHGQKLSLALLGTINFPYLNAFFGAWLDMPMRLVFVLTFLGNLVWYLILLATVLGLSSFVSNPNIIILIIVAIGVLSHFLFKFAHHDKTQP